MQERSLGILEELVGAARALEAIEDKFFESGSESALADVVLQTAKAWVAIADDAERALRLGLLADVCAQMEGAPVVDALLLILGDTEPYVRAKAGDALQEHAEARFAEVARAIEKTLAKQEESFALRELPFLLYEITDPDPSPLLVKFLSHPDKEAVVSAIEVLTTRGDPRARKHLEKLRGDQRKVTLDDSDDEVTIADLIEQALETFDED